MQEHDRTAFLDSMIGAVASNLWRDLSERARAVLPVIGSHAALFGREEPVTYDRICEHSGLDPEEVPAAVEELLRVKLAERIKGPEGLRGVILAQQGEPVPGGSATEEAVCGLIDGGALKVYGNLTIHVEEPSVELVRLTAELAELLAAQACAREREAARVAHKVEIVRYHEPAKEPSPS